LEEGWNLVSFLEDEPRDINDIAMEYYEDPNFRDYYKFVSVWAYADGSWKTHVPNNLGLGDLTIIEPGRGYWVNVKRLSSVDLTARLENMLKDELKTKESNIVKESFSGY